MANKEEYQCDGLVVGSGCGGRFPHDLARRQKMFPHAPTGREHYSPGPTSNTGDG